VTTALKALERPGGAKHLLLRLDPPELALEGRTFEGFTDQARRVVVLAQEEARLLNHHYIGTEHLLLGVAREGKGVAAQALAAVGADDARVREQVVRLLTGEGEQAGPRTRLVRMTVPEDLRELEERIAQVRRQKEAATEAKDFDGAAALRERERQLLADQTRGQRRQPPCPSGRTCGRITSTVPL
jgi:ATP-dependent Clp protease ATP-binding subunit ClpA